MTSVSGRRRGESNLRSRTVFENTYQKRLVISLEEDRVSPPASFDQDLERGACVRAAIDIVAHEYLDRMGRPTAGDVGVDHPQHGLQQMRAAVNIGDGVDPNAVRQLRLVNRRARSGKRYGKRYRGARTRWGRGDNFVKPVCGQGAEKTAHLSDSPIAPKAWRSIVAWFVDTRRVNQAPSPGCIAQTLGWKDACRRTTACADTALKRNL